MEHEIHTRRLESGGLEKYQSDNDEVIIDPPQSEPELLLTKNARWTLSPDTVGMIERICRARFDVQQLLPKTSDNWAEVLSQEQSITPGGEPVNVNSVDDLIPVIYQTVYASTKLEGEEIYSEDMPIAIAGHPSTRQELADYGQRVKGARDAYKAYIWALSRPVPREGGGYIDPDFILDLHDRMFSSSKPKNAGCFKPSNNSAQRNGITLTQYLPANRVSKFMLSLCQRLNQQFEIADGSGRYSKLISVAEFTVDFLAIHPFADGNGRMARMLSTYLLEAAGFRFARFYSLDSVILDRHDEYHKCLRAAQTNWYTSKENLTPWINFYIAAVYEQWRRSYEEIVRRVQQTSP